MGQLKAAGAPLAIGLGCHLAAHTVSFQTGTLLVRDTIRDLTGETVPTTTPEHATVTSHHQIRGATVIVAIVIILALVLEMTTTLPTRAYSALTGAAVTSRGLTEDEAALADHLFGDGFSEGITITAANTTSGRARVRGISTIVVPQTRYRTGDGTIRELPAGLLAHELTHVWQSRTQPLRTAIEAPLATIGEQLGQLTPNHWSPYDVTEEDALRKGWNGLSIEQQAEAVEAYANDGLGYLARFGRTVEAGLGIEPLDSETVEMGVGGTEMPYDDFGFDDAQPVHIDALTVEYQGVGVARKAKVYLTPTEATSENKRIVTSGKDSLDILDSSYSIELDQKAAGAFDPSIVEGATLDDLISSDRLPAISWVSIG